jgi:hypothetical protein
MTRFTNNCAGVDPNADDDTEDFFALWYNPTLRMAYVQMKWERVATNSTHQLCANMANFRPMGVDSFLHAGLDGSRIAIGLNGDIRTSSPNHGDGYAATLMYIYQ